MNPEESNRCSTKLSRDKGTSRKRCPQESSEDETDDEGNNCKNKPQGTESSSSYQFVKRQRRRTSSRERSRSISVTVTTFDYSSSGDETIYSAQGYETVAVGDMDDLVSDECSDTGNLDEETIETMRAQAAAEAADAVAEEDTVPAETPESNDSSDNIFEIEDVYQIEYEPESEIDTEIDEQGTNKGKSRRNSAQFSDSDTDLEDVIVVAATLFELTDLAEWADSSDTEPSDSGIETPSATSKEKNPSIQPDLKGSSDESVETSTQPIKCISCNQPDVYLPPLMKECHGCWQKRRGHMPDRPKPRRRKNKGKGKNSNGRNLKGSVASIQKNRMKESTSRGGLIRTDNYNSEQTASSHTSDASSQEMVMDDEVDTQSMVKRPSLNRSFSENYETSSKKHINLDSVSVQSDGEERRNITDNRLVDKLTEKEKSFSLDSIESTTGSTQSIDSQKSCDSGFIEAGLGKHSIREPHDSFDDASEALDTEDDTANSHFSKNKNTISTLQNESEVFYNKKRDVLGSSKSSSTYTENVNKYPGEKGCESNSTLCNICNERPKDACFVHQKISHQFCCYKCAKKQYRINPVCPVCRRKVEKITRNILA
jgi:E3 ubiquitin-protein ligase Mdm2